MRLSAGVGDVELKLAREFAETKAKLNKTLKPGEELADDAVDVAEFKAYSGAFRRMISNRQGEHGLSLDEQKSMSVGSDPNGGYLVTPAVSNRVMMKIGRASCRERVCQYV